jgi:hypothetical protein
LQKIEKRKLTEYKIQLAIVQNPHVKEPKDLWRMLNRQSGDNGLSRPKQFDDTGFELFKNTLSQNPRFVVK